MTEDYLKGANHLVFAAFGGVAAGLLTGLIGYAVWGLSGFVFGFWIGAIAGWMVGSIRISR